MIREGYGLNERERQLIADRKSGKYCPGCDGPKHTNKRLTTRHTSHLGIWETYCLGKLLKETVKVT